MKTTCDLSIHLPSDYTDSLLPELFEMFRRNARKRSRLGLHQKLEMSPLTVKAFYDIAKDRPDAGICFPFLMVRGELAGFALIQEMHQPKLVDGMVSSDSYSFIWAVFKDPRFGKEGTSFLKEFVVRWAKDRGHRFICGNCPPNFRTKAAEREGFKVFHVVVGMEL